VCVVINCVVPTEKYNVMVNSEELIGTTAYLILYTRCHINRRHYNWVAHTYIHLKNPLAVIGQLNMKHVNTRIHE